MAEFRRRSSWRSDSSSVSSSLEKSNDAPTGVSSASGTSMRAAEESKPFIGEPRPDWKESELVDEREVVEDALDADGLGYGDAVEALDFASARGMLWILNSGKKADGSG